MSVSYYYSVSIPSLFSSSLPAIFVSLFLSGFWSDHSDTVLVCLPDEHEVCACIQHPEKPSGC